MIGNSSRRVLVVDDEPSVREMLSDFLEMNNFICMQADNGESAVNVSRKEKFDLIIMDVRMPGVSGIEALREIKRDQPRQAVVMVTAVSEVETAVEAMRLGASDYVMKPFVLHDMLRTVDSAISEETDQVVEMPMPDSQAPMTIAVGTPVEATPGPTPGALSYDVELLTLAEDVEAIYDQVAALKTRMDILTRPRRMVQALVTGGPDGDQAA